MPAARAGSPVRPDLAVCASRCTMRRLAPRGRDSCGRGYDQIAGRKRRRSFAPALSRQTKSRPAVHASSCAPAARDPVPSRELHDARRPARVRVEGLTPALTVLVERSRVMARGAHQQQARLGRRRSRDRTMCGPSAPARSEGLLIGMPPARAAGPV
jgi:hypothetical protein